MIYTLTIEIINKTNKMKNTFSKLVILSMLLTAFFAFGQSDTINVVQEHSPSFFKKMETSSVSTIDGFITKYEPKISNKMGELWEFSKKTTKTMYGAFIRYLVVKDGFPLVIGIILILILRNLTRKLTHFFNTTELFAINDMKSSFNDYETLMVEKENRVNKIYNKLFGGLGNTLFYVGLAYIAYTLMPYLYNLLLLIVSPEARVVMELTNIYKSF